LIRCEMLFRRRLLASLLLLACLFAVAISPVLSDESSPGTPSLREGGSVGDAPSSGHESVERATSSESAGGGDEKPKKKKKKVAADGAQGAASPPPPPPAAPKASPASPKKSTTPPKKKSPPKTSSVNGSPREMALGALKEVLEGVGASIKALLNAAAEFKATCQRIVSGGLPALKNKYEGWRSWTNKFIESKKVRKAMSVLLMLDLVFVFVSIQSQLDSMRERNIDYALERVDEFENPVHNALRVPISLWHKTPWGSKGANIPPPKITHLQKSEIFKLEEIFSMQASITILGTLLVEKVAHVWSQDLYWRDAKVSEKLDVCVLSLSIIFEMIFARMEHDGSLKTLKGSVLRWVTENWRFVRIIHGSYETLTHSPIVAPLVKGT